MELGPSQIRDINRLTRSYYDYLASELHIINPSADLDAYKKQLITAMTDLARGASGIVPSTYRRVRQPPRPTPRRWDLSSVVTREVRRNLRDLLVGVEPKWQGRIEDTPDTIFGDLDDLIHHLKELPQKTVAPPRLSLPTVPKLATPIRAPSVPSLRAPPRIPLSSPRVPPSSPLVPPSSPRVPSSTRATTPIQIPVTPIGPSSDIETNILLERMRDLAPAMINKSAEIARILGLDEAGLREGLSVFVERP